MRCVIIANASSLPGSLFIESAKKCDLLIAADGGAAYCERLDLQPHIIVGDMDSISPMVLEKFSKTSEIIRHPVEKELTDLELARNLALERKASSLQIFGWADDRIDFSWGSLIAFSEIPIPTELFTSQNRVVILNKNYPRLELKEVGQQISILPLAENLHLKSQGLQWELDWRDAKIGKISQSNRVRTAGKIQISKSSVALVFPVTK